MDMPEDKVRKVLKIAKEPISMETPIGDDEDSHLGDFIEDANISSPIDSATGSGLTGTVQGVLAGLTPREAKVLRMRFGIDMNTNSIRRSAKLRHPTRSSSSGVSTWIEVLSGALTPRSQRARTKGDRTAARRGAGARSTRQGMPPERDRCARKAGQTPERRLRGHVRRPSGRTPTSRKSPAPHALFGRN
jgi:hypothetical protein